MKNASSPEGFNAPLKVVGRPEWLALAGVATIMFGGIAWGVLGVVPTTVGGHGILLRKGGGAIAVTAETEAQVAEILVRTGDEVRKGQAVGRLRLTAGKDHLESSERKLASLRKQRAQALDYWSKYLPAQQASLELERGTTQKVLQNAIESAEAAKGELEAAQSLFERGVTTKTRLDQTRQAYFEAIARRDDLTVKAKALESKMIELTSERDRALNSFELLLIEAESELKAARDALNDAEILIAAESGRISEVMVNTGDYIAAGTHVMAISYGDPALSAVIYVPAANGQTIKPGMTARIMPNAVRTDEYGVVIGAVKSVSLYPVSRSAIQRQVSNDDLAQSFLQSGPQIEVLVDLESDPETPSGLKWSSGRGPATILREGELAGANVTVREQPPASLVIPALRRVLGVSPSTE